MPLQKPLPCPYRARFGKNVAQLRRLKGLTQERLAEQLGISVRYEQSVEAGEYFPALPNLVKLRAILGVSWDELLAGCE